MQNHHKKISNFEKYIEQREASNLIKKKIQRTNEQSIFLSQSFKKLSENRYSKYLKNI